MRWKEKEPAPCLPVTIKCVGHGPQGIVRESVFVVTIPRYLKSFLNRIGTLLVNDILRSPLLVRCSSSQTQQKGTGSSNRKTTHNGLSRRAAEWSITS